MQGANEKNPILRVTKRRVYALSDKTVPRLEQGSRYRFGTFLRRLKQPVFVEEQLRLDPGYFKNLSEGQHPAFLWIGC